MLDRGPAKSEEPFMTKLHTRGGMRMPRKGEGTLHLDHLSIWIYTGKSLELPQLRDTSLNKLVRGFYKICAKGPSAFHQLDVVEIREVSAGKIPR